MTGIILTQDVLKELIDYDKDTGIFIWKERDLKWADSPRECKRWNAKTAGRVAGSLTYQGYTRICIFSVRYLAHRLAFLYIDGELPVDQVDHINGVRNDNIWSNLRHCDAEGNNKNSRIPKHNTSGVIGVYWDKYSNKWKAAIRSKRKLYHLGYFSSLEEAKTARKIAEKEYGFHKNHGRRC